MKFKKRGNEIKKKIFSSETTEHNFERGPPKDHFSKVWLRLVQYLSYSYK
jgi:hypothetical protein